MKSTNKMLRFLRDIHTNFDCDNDAHKYNTMCRACEAGNIWREVTEELSTIERGERDGMATNQRIWESWENWQLKAIQSYNWVSRVVIVDESKDRLVVNEMPLSDFLKEIKQWRLMEDFEFEEAK